MLKLHHAIILGTAFLIAACQSVPGSVHDKHTGETVTHSSRTQIEGGLLTSLHAQALYSDSEGYLLSVDYSATGVGWAFFKEAWSLGKKFQYHQLDRSVLGCGAGCTIQESGMIELSEADFMNAANKGFEFKLIGQKRSIEAKAPATLFQEVISEMKR